MGEAYFGKPNYSFSYWYTDPGAVAPPPSVTYPTRLLMMRVGFTILLPMFLL